MLRRISLSQDRFLYAGFSKARGSRNWVVYVPESGAGFQDGSQSELRQHLKPSLAAKFNYLVINKSGLRRSGTDRQVFESSFRRDLRVEDALKAMWEIVPADGKIFLIGYSEGAYLAPEIARRDRRVEAVAMIGGGTRGWLKEELSQARNRAEVARMVRRIYRAPQSMVKWHDFSYATWYSYREDRTLKALRSLNKPVLAVLGARDRVIDFKSALSDLRRLKQVDVRVLHGCGHEFSGHWRKVRTELDAWSERHAPLFN